MKKSNSNGDLMRVGWVKVPRWILDTQIIKNPTLCQLYLWCLLKANHKEAWVNLKVGRGIQTVNCKQGQFITGRNKAAEELGLPPSTYNSNIKKLRDYGYIDIESTKHYSIVTVNINDDCGEDKSKLEQDKTKSNDKKMTIKGHQTDTNNKNNNLKNYKKNNSLNNFKEYNKFLSDSDFKKSDKNLFKDYESLVAVITSELYKIQSLGSILSPSQYQDLRGTYSRDSILEKLKQMDSWKGLNHYHNIYKLLTQFLNKSQVDTQSKEKIKRDELGIQRVGLDGIFTFGILKAEIDDEINSNDNIDWIKYDISGEHQIRKYVAKCLRLRRYINGSDLARLKALEPISLKEFLIIAKRSRILLVSNDEDFDAVKKILRDISSWPDIEGYKKQAKAIYAYLKSNNLL